MGLFARAVRCKVHSILRVLANHHNTPELAIEYLKSGIPHTLGRGVPGVTAILAACIEVDPLSLKPLLSLLAHLSSDDALEILTQVHPFHGLKPLHILVQGGLLAHREAAELLLQQASRMGIAGSVLEGTDDKGRTALSMAAARLSPEFVTLLLQYGADPNHADRAGDTPLMRACHANGSVQALYAIMSDMVQAGVDLGRKDAKGLTVLQYVMSFNLDTSLYPLLRDSPLPDNDHPDHPIFQLVSQPVAIYSLFAERGGVRVLQPEWTDGAYALMIAVGRGDGHFEMVEYLVTRGRAEARDPIPDPDFIHDEDFINHQRDNEGRTVLGYSITRRVFDYLLAQGADPLAVAKDQSTVAHLFLRGSHLLSLPVVRDHHPVMIETLLARGLDVNATDRRGWTLVMEAAYAGSWWVMAVLVAKGADLSRLDNRGRSVLDRVFEGLYNVEVAVQRAQELYDRGARFGPGSEALAMLVDNRTCTIEHVDAVIKMGATLSGAELVNAVNKRLSLVVLERLVDLGAEITSEVLRSPVMYPPVRQFLTDRLKKNTITRLRDLTAGAAAAAHVARDPSLQQYVGSSEELVVQERLPIVVGSESDTQESQVVLWLWSECKEEVLGLVWDMMKAGS